MTVGCPARIRSTFSGRSRTVGQLGGQDFLGVPLRLWLWRGESATHSPGRRVALRLRLTTAVHMVLWRYVPCFRTFYDRRGDTRHTLGTVNGETAGIPSGCCGRVLDCVTCGYTLQYYRDVLLAGAFCCFIDGRCFEGSAHVSLYIVHDALVKPAPRQRHRA